MKKKRAYLIGIKGVAMTALAVYLKEKGFAVSGSDTEEVFLTDKILKARKILVKKGFSPKNLSQKYDLVVVTGAHGGLTNPEAQQAIKLGYPTFMHGVFLGKLLNKSFGISVAGCHGKTSTAALIASLLTHSGFDPSFAVGTAEINDLGPAGHFGKSNFFVAEADEYMTCPQTCKTPRFLWQKPKILVITNIDYDHPDAFSNLNEVKTAFLNLTNNMEKNSLVIACIDNNNIREILPKIKVPFFTYGFSPLADFQITNSYFGEGVSFMRLKSGAVDLGEYMLHLSGKHNLLNALAASIAVNHLGISWERIKESLKFYTGCKRRFEKIAEYHKIMLFDDYAHHPSEIRATLNAVKNWFSKKRIIAIFQPHTFSRTKKLLPEFKQAFIEADIALITDIYPSAREVTDPTINSQILVNEIQKYKPNAIYKKNKEEVISFLKKEIKDNDFLITMGAGDIFLWHEDLVKILKERFYE